MSARMDPNRWADANRPPIGLRWLWRIVGRCFQ